MILPQGWCIYLIMCFSYVSAVMRGCLARRKYKCLQNEKESKASRNKLQEGMRKNNISEPRTCHVSSVKGYHIIILKREEYYIIVHSNLQMC